MKRLLAMIALVGAACLTACTPGGASPAPGSAPASPSDSIETPGSTEGTPSSSAGAGDVKDACELFNSLYAEFAATAKDDADAFDDIYLRADEAQTTAPEEVSGLFYALSLLALDRSLGDAPSQESKDAIQDAFLASSVPCTAEGVTLKI
ncbi:hypothetical protein [Arthrobacter celericrescens]|uniref:hypothetical protein n=1 Tax=Arthrobacter celericrescens TaxID=2320851 RepID=UPI000EA22F99|nr:hypothetical protein [Arthrobacter celericrescens]